MVAREKVVDEELAIGRLGELEVELALVKRGWHAIRLDTARMAANADLLAIQKRVRISIQVKTTNATTKHSHWECLGFGYSTNYIKYNRQIFNTKDGPLIADVVVAVSYREPGPRFVILPVAFAEILCRRHVDYWRSVPTRIKNAARSGSFPIYLSFTDAPQTHREHHMRILRNVQLYEDRWDILFEPVDRLHDPDCWKLVP